MKKYLLITAAAVLTLSTAANAETEVPVETATVACSQQWLNMFGQMNGGPSALRQRLQAKVDAGATTWLSAGKDWEKEFRVAQPAFINSMGVCGEQSFAPYAVQYAGVTGNPVVTKQAPDPNQASTPPSGGGGELVAPSEPRVDEPASAVVATQPSQAELKRLAALEADKVNLQTQINTLNAKDYLTVADRNVLAGLNSRFATVNSSLEAMEKRINERINAQDRRMNAVVGKDGNTGLVGDLSKRVGALESAGVPNWLMGSILAMLLFSGGLSVYNFFFKSSKKQLRVLARDVADGAQDRKKISIQDNMQETLQSLPNGAYTDIWTSIDGEDGYIGFTKVGKGYVTTDCIDTQTQKMSIEDLPMTLNRHIGAGRVKLLPCGSGEPTQLHEVAVN